MAFDPLLPFVLLDDARLSGAGTAKLFTAPVEVITAHDPADVSAALDQLCAASSRGLWAAGFAAFEAGYALEDRLTRCFRQPNTPLVWFGLFERRQSLTAEEVIALTAGRAAITEWGPRIAEADFLAALARAKALIAAGDVYQVNLTFPADIAYDGHPLALYGRLRQAQRAPYGAVINTGTDWHLSLSPELFFTLEAGVLTARPMKGTAARLPQPAADRAAARALAADAKNRAENLMIVDLLRNDLSRVSKAGSVEVPKLFDVETYPTIHTMTSTVTAALQPGLHPVDVIRTIFPCGSVTGAPKIRAMEVIADLEPDPRGLYTGSIGVIAPDGDAMFNVAIRTLSSTGDGRAVIGLGAGIVADSEAGAEWAECLAKGAFLDRAARPTFDLFETMRWEPGEGMLRLDRHIARLKASARYHGFPLNSHAIGNLLQQSVAGRPGALRIRLMLSASGEMVVHASPAPINPPDPVPVTLAALPVRPSDPRLAHKTTDRAFYDDARTASGAFEVLFVAPEGQLTEGSFTNIFVERDGCLLTPPLDAGLLPGVLRADLIASGRAIESRLTAADLSHDVFIGNSLRGLLRARLVTA